MYVYCIRNSLGINLPDPFPDPFISEKFRIAVMSKTELVALIPVNNLD
jgi:hypothetical protein